MKRLADPQFEIKEWLIEYMVDKNSEIRCVDIPPEHFIDLIKQYRQQKHTSRRVLSFLRWFIKMNIKEYTRQFTETRQTLARLENALNPKDTIPLYLDTDESTFLVSPCVKLGPQATYIKNIKHKSKPKYCNNETLFKVEWIEKNQRHAVVDSQLEMWYGIPLVKEDFNVNTRLNNNYYFLPYKPEEDFCIVHNSVIILADYINSFRSTDYTYVYKGVYGRSPCYVPGFSHAVTLDDLKAILTTLYD